MREFVKEQQTLEREGDVYSSMPHHDAKNYQKLKTALLKWYELTEVGFHWKFRENQQFFGVTVFQFVAPDGLIWRSVKKLRWIIPPAHT